MFAVQNINIHQPAYYPSFGEGFEDAFRNVNLAWSDQNLFQRLGIEIGEKWIYENAIYQAVRVRGGNVAKGDWVKLNFGGATRLGTVAAAPAAARDRIASSFNITAGELVNPSKSVPSLLFITSGTAIGIRRRILQNYDSTDATFPNEIVVSFRADYANQAANSANNPDAFSTLPVTGDGLSIIAPWEVIKTASVYDLPQGVMAGDCTQDQIGVVVVAGLALAKCVGSTDALVAQQPIVISATAGVAKGRVAVPGSATIAMQEGGGQVGWAVDAYSGATALRHVWLNGQHAL